MAHAAAADRSSTPSLNLTDNSTYVSTTVRLEHVEDFYEESGVLQGTKVCSMKEN